jgi:hypothetical protein
VIGDGGKNGEKSFLPIQSDSAHRIPPGRDRPRAGTVMFENTTATAHAEA